MSPTLAATASTLLSGIIADISGQQLLVDIGAGPQPCDKLVSSTVPLGFTIGDEVLVGILPGRERPLVLGLIQSTQLNSGRPDEIILQAAEKIILRCGDGSITLRRDGTVTIRGTHLISHAKALNRIMGGSVAIN